MARDDLQRDDPRFPALERAGMIGILAGVALSTGANIGAREALGLPYVALFSTYFIAAFGGYVGWMVIMRWTFGAWSRARGGVLVFCLLVAVLVGFGYTVAVGALGIAMDDGPAANAVVLPLDLVAFLVVRRWLHHRGR